MKKIKLTQGKYALVDNEDFEYLNQLTWHYTQGYVESQVDGNHVRMHRIVNKTPAGKLTDHINRNTLDNRRNNLRTADKRINAINTGLQSNNRSGYKGICWSKQTSRWETYIWNQGTKIHLGRFKDINHAIIVRREAERAYHGI